MLVKKLLGSSWKTSVSGLIAFGLLIAPQIWPDKSNLFCKISQAATAAGLIAAADSSAKKRGKKRKQKTVCQK